MRNKKKFYISLKNSDYF